MSKTLTKGRNELPSFLQWLLPLPTHNKVQLRQRMTIAALWEQYLRRPGIWGHIGTVVSTWPLFIGIWSILPNYSDYNHAADARTRIVESFTMRGMLPDQAIIERKMLAGDLLDTYMHGIHSDITTGGDTASHTNMIMRGLQEVQKTGRAITLDTVHDTFNNHLPGFAIGVAILLYACLMILVGARYALATLSRVEYLADLPWHRGWPLIFLVLSPILLPVYIVSAVRLAYVKRFISADVISQETIPYSFTSNNEGARRLYFDLRFGDWRIRVRDRMQAIEERIAEIVAIAQANQRERSALQAERRTLDAFNIQVDTPDSTVVREEFENMVADPWVHGLGVEGDSLVVFTKSRFLYRGVVYDLGDWAIYVSVRGIRTIELRSGIKVAWHTMHPIYRNGDNSFCFGQTMEILNGLLAKGELSKVVSIAVEAIRQVNPSDQSLVPVAFKVATDVSTQDALFISTEGSYDSSTSTHT